MFFRPKDSLTDSDVDIGKRSIIQDGIASTAMGTLTSGTFLIAFVVLLGGSNFIIGLLAAIPPLLQLLQIPSILLIEKLKNRKAICVITAGVSRLFWLPIIAIPFIFSSHAAVMVLVVSLILHSAFGAVAGCSWNSWIRDVLPQEGLGNFFSRRMRISTVVGIALSFLAAVFIDKWRIYFPSNTAYGYSILFSLGLFAGMAGLIFISRIPEPMMAVSEKNKSFARVLIEPFRNENFKNLMVFLCSWSFAVNLAAPFFTVYMLKRLELDMSFIIFLSIVSQLVHLLFLKIWGKFSDTFSNKSVLAVSGPIFIGTILLWTFTTMPEKHMLTLPLLIIIYILMGISTAGVNLAAGNISFKLAPRGSATAYLTASNFAIAIAASIAPILGGKFADFFTRYQLSWTLKWTGPTKEFAIQTLNFQSWDFFFALAFLIGLYSLHRLALVKEEGEVDEHVVLEQLMIEVKDEIKNFTTVGGVKQVIDFPFAIFREVKRAGKRGKEKIGRMLT
ncbi:MAG: MFS transporter [Candidatus Omnitrophota bacterium]